MWRYRARGCLVLRCLRRSGSRAVVGEEWLGQLTSVDLLAGVSGWYRYRALKLTIQICILDSGSLDIVICTGSRTSTGTNCPMWLVGVISVSYLEYAGQLT
jgi:hypothetical protein